MKLKALTVLIAAVLAAPSAFAEDDQARIDKLEQKVAELESQGQVHSWLNRFNVNGFATVGMGRASNDAGYADYDNDGFDFENDSILAVQTTYDVNDEISATLQLVTRGRQDWDLKAEWAFLSYQFNDATTIRGGKLRLPLYMLSDYLEVGYAYPWARPSEEVYGVIPVSTFTGFDVIHVIDFDESALTFQPIFGESTVDADDSRLGLETNFKKVYGLATTYDWDELTLRASYFHSETDIDPVPWLDDKTGEFYGLGARWDNGDWMVMGEFTRIEVDGQYPDTDSAYIGATYRYNQFSPYVMISWVESKDNGERTIPIPGVVSALDVERGTTSAGVRWDFMPNVAVKFDLTYTDDFDDTSGALSGNIGTIDIPSVGPVPVNTGEYDESFIYSVLIDVVF
ncbi:porin [Corallincola luteus]|uniref:Porin n=1 Tax=Corallincola luteus TaxID=1775177 RepID=A0ABY2AP22_9GAMM|nr:porin [Corallincola luteus]TCI04949.1 porin [Corallincola luteus]